MDFDLTQEHTMLRDSLRRMLADFNAKNAPAELGQESAENEETLYAALVEMGVIGACFSEADGGFAGGGLDISLVFEELGRAGVQSPLLGRALLPGWLIARLGDEAQREHVTDLISGTGRMAVAHGEVGGRYDLEQVSVRPVENSGILTVSGVKRHVINGDSAESYIVSVREDGEDHDLNGISLYLFSSDLDDLTVTTHRTIDGAAHAHIELNNIPLAEMQRLGGKGQGFEALEEARARAILAVCAEAVGAMDTALGLTVEYLQVRKQFGKPLSTFQVLQHRLADLAIEVEQARSAVANLATYLTAPRTERETYVSAAKNLVGRAGATLAEECIQLHGGIGMTEEYSLSGFARRLVMMDHLFGDTDYHLERFISLTAASPNAQGHEQRHT